MSEWTYSGEISEELLVAPQELLVALDGGGWGVIGASVAGRRASAGREAGLECAEGGIDQRDAKEMQDACAAAVNGQGEMVAAIADGAGSARLGGLGARMAVASAIRLMASWMPWSPGSGVLPFESINDWRQACFRMMRSVRCQLMKCARELKVRRDEVACTLTVVYANPVMVLAAQIGDGRAAVLWGDGEWEAITAPQRGEHAGETQFLTSSGWRRDPQAIDVRMAIGEVHAVALLTDGCERVAFECQRFDAADGRYARMNRPHVPFLTPNVQALQQMLDSAHGNAPGDVARMWGAFLREGTPELPMLSEEPDDKTLLLAVRRRPPQLQSGATADCAPAGER